MEESNHFTCLAYDTIDFLIQSKYVLFGIYLHDFKERHELSGQITFEGEVLPHIYIGQFLEENFQCRSVEECNVMLVMKKEDFDEGLQKLIVDFTGTEFPPSGNFALSVNSAVSSKVMDISFLRLMPKGIRPRQNECGVIAIGYGGSSEKDSERKQILVSPDNLLRTIIQSKIERCGA